MAPRKKRPARAYGEGSIYTDKAGNTYYQPAPIDGHRQSKIRCVDSAHAARVKAEYLAELAAKKAAGVDLLSGAMLLHTWLAWWFDNVKAPKLAATTRAERKRLIRAYLFLLPNVALEKLAFEQVVEWVNDIQTRISVYNTRTAYALLMEALDQAVASGKIVRNKAAGATLPALPDEPRTAVYLTDAELLTVLDTLDAERRRMVYLTAVLGFRRGEVLGLSLARFDADRALLKVDGQIQTVSGDTKRLDRLKNKPSRRTIALPASVVAVLSEQRAAVYARRLQAGATWQEHGLLFPGKAGAPLKPDTITHWWQDLLERLHLPAMTYHGLRHMAITRLDVLGVRESVAGSIVGHKPATQTGGYVTVSPADQRHAIELAVQALRQTERQRKTAGS